MRAWIVTALVVFAAGCGASRDEPAFPDLVAVAGVIHQDGRPVGGGSIRFTPVPERDEFLINSEVGPDGRFTLATDSPPRVPRAVSGVAVTVERAGGAPAPTGITLLARAQ